jgi:ketosteroid isomerase-like protein
MTQNASSIPEAISRTNTQFMEAVRRRDSGGMAAVYTESASIFPPNAAARTGRDAIRGFWQGILDLGVAEVLLETIEFEPAGESGWESGRATITAGDGSVIDELKYVVVWQQENGAWKWHRDIWNSSRPND